ncbi:hypothetical protein [Magnetospirillum sp. SS-4]|uniref:hypothetical protein n=1 Tax=Magnetospirillum sp. SS-4 TaxID=2681465 RepID=UPI001574AD0F|nr:hypothetical protein [Magnetospirillum sp. SS-4]
MTPPGPDHRECADCYYRRGARCLSAAARTTTRSGGCGSFLRASLRFAFFHGIEGGDTDPPRHSGNGQ